MNWMNAACFLFGVTMGILIAWMAVKHRFDGIVVLFRSLDDDVSEVIEANTRILDKWSETVDLNTELIEAIKEKF